MLNFKVDSSRCTRCGMCVRDCPVRIIEFCGNGEPGVSAEKEGSCIECQHCLAVCPTGAISVFGLDPEQSLPLSPESFPKFEQMDRLLRGRRSVRQYLDKNVERGLIDRMLSAVANCPTGCNSRQLTFTVVDDKDVMGQVREKVMRRLIKAVENGKIPQEDTFFRGAIAAYAGNGVDVIFRGAPHAMIVSASPEALCAAEDVSLAVAYFELLAASAGLGTVWCGFLKIAFEKVPELKSLVGLPEGHAYYAILFGYPNVHYARTVQRDQAARVVKVQRPGKNG